MMEQNRASWDITVDLKVHGGTNGTVSDKMRNNGTQ